MGTVVSGFSGPVAAVFLLAENRLLREALLRILSKKDDIQVVGAGSYGPDVFEQIVSTRANVVVLDSVSKGLSVTFCALFVLSSRDSLPATLPSPWPARASARLKAITWGA